MPTENQRRLGANGPLVSSLGFGCMNLSAYYSNHNASNEERFKVLDAAADLGATFWVTSDVYNDSEELLGKWFDRTGRRNEIFLATKFGYEQRGAQEYPALRSDPDFVKQACDKSLETLNTSKIDLYMAHRVDGKTPIEKTIQAMAELKQEGKISYLGLSEVSAATLRRAHNVHPISAVEVEYSPFSLDIESDQINLLSTCRELGIAIIAYSPLGRGILTGRYRSLHDFKEGDGRRFMPRFSAENFPRNLHVVEQFVSLSKEKNCTPSQLTLAWLLKQGSDILPIPGTSNVRNLKENMDALKVELSDTEVQEIRKVVDTAEIHGARYPDGYTEETYRDTPSLTCSK